MKSTFLFICIILLAMVSASGQVCSTTPITSPVSPKPLDGSVASATCSTLVVQWQGHPADQDYLVKGTYLDPTTQIKTETAPAADVSCDGSQNCMATIEVVAGTAVSWTVQAQTQIDGKTYLSYPLRSTEAYPIPDCVSGGVTERLAPKERMEPFVDLEAVQGKVFPNPVHSTLNISLNRLSQNGSQLRVVLRILDGNGQVVITRQAQQGNSQVDVSRLPAGTYILSVSTNSGKELYTVRFVKQ